MGEQGKKTVTINGIETTIYFREDLEKYGGRLWSHSMWPYSKSDEKSLIKELEKRTAIELLNHEFERSKRFLGEQLADLEYKALDEPRELCNNNRDELRTDIKNLWGKVQQIEGTVSCHVSTTKRVKSFLYTSEYVEEIAVKIVFILLGLGAVVVGSLSATWAVLKIIEEIIKLPIIGG